LGIPAKLPLHACKPTSCATLLKILARRIYFISLFDFCIAVRAFCQAPIKMTFVSQLHWPGFEPTEKPLFAGGILHNACDANYSPPSRQNHLKKDAKASKIPFMSKRTDVYLNFLDWQI